MSEIESTHRDHASDETRAEHEAYEPPRITSLGTVGELTSGGGGGPGDVDSVSNAVAAQGRRDASANAPIA
jgi:hypothetical protein